MRTQSEIREAFAAREDLSRFSSFYLVGIGGAGMSGIAKMLQRRGFSVRGSDSTPSATTAELEAAGISVRIGHTGEGIRSEDAVVLSDAISVAGSPEVRRARELGCPLFRRSQALGWLLRGKKVITVTGTHGKTTTTGLLGAGLRASGMDPTIVVGAPVEDFGGAVVEGFGEWAVVEACEAYDSFHDLDPDIIVLTNLEMDHADFHGSFENLKASVMRFVSKLAGKGPSGTFVYCGEDSGALDIAANLPKGIKALEYRSGGIEGPIRLPGSHNELNASGAYAAAVAAGAEPGAAAKGIAEFRGAERRLQEVLSGEVTVLDDYAHHPSEIKASLQAVRGRYFGEGRAGARLVAVFQPHLYSRTKDLIREFAATLSLADFVILTDIYPAREAPIPGVSSARIAELVTVPLLYVPSRHLLARKVAGLALEGDVIVVMGAGNIGEMPPELVRELGRRGLRGDGSAEKKARSVAVIYGGDSAEREVSLLSGAEVHAALLRTGYDARLVDVTDLLLGRGDLSSLTGVGRPDLAFLTVHGTNAEDGAIQGLFELLHIPYTGSGIQSSAIAMDKRLTKQILGAAGIRVPRGISIERSAAESRDAVRKELLDRNLTPPLVVKPNAQGSTVGLGFVAPGDDLWRALQMAFQYGDSALIEEWIEGIELSVPVLGSRALPPVEIAPLEGRYDFAAKYTPGATEEIIPARISKELDARCREVALKAHQVLGCSGATRTDMILRANEIFVLELNTLPGMTSTSLLPNSAAADGLSFDDLVDWMAQDAMARHEAKA